MLFLFLFQQMVTNQISSIIPTDTWSKFWDTYECYVTNFSKVSEFSIFIPARRCIGRWSCVQRRCKTLRVTNQPPNKPIVSLPSTYACPASISPSTLYCYAVSYPSHLFSSIAVQSGGKYFRAQLSSAALPSDYLQPSSLRSALANLRPILYSSLQLHSHLSTT